MSVPPDDRFADLVVPSTGTIRDAMQAISANGREVVLVRGEGARIVGLITDGDIRRGLLRGLTLGSPAADVMTRDFFAVAPGADRAAVLDMMMARVIRHVPVVDDERRLVAIHFLRDLIGAAPKPNVAVIMAGGKGTRLRPLTDNLPKPMVEVAGRPILERLVLHLVSHGVSRIYLAVNFLAERIERHFGDGGAFGCRIEYLRETTALGTGGALSLLPSPPGHSFLVMNGDQITNIDVTKLLQFHAERGVAATIAAGPHSVEIPFGVVRENAGRLVEIEEKPTLHFAVNRGIYVLDPSVLGAVPVNCAFPITDLFGKLIADGKEVGVFYFDDQWIDVGRHEDFRRANGLE